MSDRLGYRRRAVVIASLALALPAFVVSRAISSLVFAESMLGVGFSLQFGMGVYYVYARELSAPEVTAISLTIFTSVSFVGTLVAPPLGGWLVDQFSWGLAFLIHTAVGLFGIGLVVMTPDSALDGIE